MTFEYTPDTIEVLTLREAVRKRPAMYIRGVGEVDGPLQLVLVVAAYAFDQALLGRCTRVDVRVEADDSIVFTADGPGVPASAIGELLEGPAKRRSVDTPRYSARFGHGELGLAIANALSESFEVESVHAGERVVATYAGGLRRAPLEIEPVSRPAGLRVRFRPDPRLFSRTRVARGELSRWFEDVAALVPTLALSWSFAGGDGAGLVGLVRGEVGVPLGGVAHERGEHDTRDGRVVVEVALAWPEESQQRAPQVHCFVNLRRGEDVQYAGGVFDGIVEFLSRRSRARVADGLVAAVAVLLPQDMNDAGLIRGVLADRAARPAVTQATVAALRVWAGRHPEAASELRRRDRIG